METIIRNKANIKDKQMLELEKKILIFYNAKREILIYKYKKDQIYYPFTNVLKEKSFEEIMEEKMGIKLFENNIEELIRIIDYEKFFIEKNRKLKEAYKKEIIEYYSYYMEFDYDKLSRMIDYSIKKSKFENLDLVPIEELIKLKDPKDDKIIQPLIKLRKKLNYEEY